VSWRPSAATAALIVEDIRHKLGTPAGGAGWYNIEVAVAIEVVRRACAQFPSRGIIEHDVIMQRLGAVEAMLGA
jgi:hypothetical protein